MEQQLYPSSLDAVEISHVHLKHDSVQVHQSGSLKEGNAQQFHSYKFCMDSCGRMLSVGSNSVESSTCLTCKAV